MSYGLGFHGRQKDKFSQKISFLLISELVVCRMFFERPTVQRFYTRDVGSSSVNSAHIKQVFPKLLCLAFIT